MKKVFFSVGIALALLAMPTVRAQQEPPTQGGDQNPEKNQKIRRVNWQHSQGSFVRRDRNRWEELNKRGKVVFRWVEVTQTPEYVELIDRSRGITLRLRDKMCMVQEKRNTNFGKLYEGSWVKP